MVVYSRSEKGQIAAYGEQSALPRKLKSLLRVIDGKTTLDVYVRNLHAFGDVEKVLVSLEIAGLLEHSSSTAEPANAQAADILTDIPTDNPVASGWRKLLSFRSAEANALPASEPGLTTSKSPSFSGFYETVMQSSQKPGFINQETAIKQATAEMADFILNYAPEHAFTVLKELEEISSAEQLAIAMGGYTQMVKHSGEIGARHVAKINQLLHNIL